MAKLIVIFTAFTNGINTSKPAIHWMLAAKLMGLAVLSLLPGNALEAADASDVCEPGDVDPPSPMLFLGGTGPEGKDHLRAVHLAK